MAAKLAWGILGTGNIAKTFAKGVLGSKTGTLVAVGSRTQASADAFGKDGDQNFLAGHTVTRHPSYQSLLADPAVQAVYISTPHPFHATWAIAAARAGKHILCEKPLTLNWPEAQAVVTAAAENNVFLMEAFMYRCHPVVEKLVQLVKDKVIGEVRAIQCNFAFHWPKPYNTTSRLTNNHLGGGGILDVGCYTTSLARLIAGAAIGKPISEPTDVKALGHVGKDSLVDEYSFAVLKFPGLNGHEIVASLGTGVQCNMDSTIRVSGTAGHITVPWLWIPKETGNLIHVHPEGKDKQDISVDAPANIYSLEADTVAENLEKRQAPAITWADSLGNMKTLDRWRAELKVSYESENFPNIPTVTAKPLATRTDAPMTFGHIPHLQKPLARLVFGVDKWHNPAAMARHAYALFDDYFERGGNTFDCAYVYGQNEAVLGGWINARNVREKIVLLAKGAHFPFHTLKELKAHLTESLEKRYKTPYADIYMFHRDDPSIPVGEFVGLMNELKKEGRVHAFGGSNWTPERVDAFNAYAKSHGLQGMSAISNNLSLARMVDPVWGGCVASSEPKIHDWHVKTQTPLLPWSSQARGFFTERANPNDRTTDPELVRCWYSDDNFQRQARAKELAKAHGTTPIVIALAYVLNQPFPTFPLIGPFQIEETASSFQALKLKLTPAEVRYLNLESDAKP